MERLHDRHRPSKPGSSTISSLTLPVAMLLSLSSCAPAPDGSADAPVDAAPEETAHVLEEIAPGIFFADAAGTGEVNLTSNAMIVVNEHDVLVVDSHITADAGRSLIAAVRTVSDKPIRYLVNSHYHFDHAHGNQSFAELGDHMHILGHEYTRERLLGDVLAEDTYQTIGAPEAQQMLVDQLEARLGTLDETADSEARAGLEAQLAMLRRHIQALGEVEPTPPNVTLTEKTTLFRGDREIQLLHLGRGHTGGDVVVYLPQERIAFTGDLFYAGAPYLGDGFADEFIETLGRLAELDVDTFVPGHGPLITDKSQITFNQEYLRRYWDQVQTSYEAGRTVQEAVAALDMTGYEEFAAFQVAMPAVLELEVRRMYEVMEARKADQ